MPGPLTFDGRAALITGGSRGIGAAVALLLGRLGARVCINHRDNTSAATRTLEQLAELGCKAKAVAADVTVPGEAERAVAETVAAFGALDVLVVCHGIWKPAPFETMSPGQWDETHRVNLGGAFAVCRPAVERMLAQGSGSIVLISSTAGQRGEPGYAHYAASKGGLIALTKSLSAELARRGIRVNSVAPGWVQTDMTQEALQDPVVCAATEAIPTGGPALPEQIAGPVAFLASDLASFVHGQVLSVNGGAVTTG